MWTSKILQIPESQDCDLMSNSRILKSDHSGRIFLLPYHRQRDGVRRVSVLSELHVGKRGILESLDLPESVQNHLMHMGFVPGSCISVLRRAPAGDPTVYGVDGMEIALRHETAAAIQVRPCAGVGAPETPDETPAEETPELAEATK
jgi:ferrous iron transport protein A